MKRKSNYLPCDDIQGQQSLIGLEDTVRISNSVVPIKIDKNRMIKKLLSSLPEYKEYDTATQKDVDIILDNFPYRLVSRFDGYYILRYNCYGVYTAVFKHSLLPVIKLKYDELLKVFSNIF